MNIRQRCLAVMAELKSVGREGFNQHHRYKFTPHDVVSGLLHDLFVKHGIDQEVSVLSAKRLDGSATLELEVEISWVNVDAPEERKTVRCYGHSTPTGKTREGGFVAPDDLGVGKALSYAVKYAQLKNFTLTGDSTPDLEDEDKPAAAATTEEVERVLNALASATTQAAFNAAADMATAIADRVTQDQQKILGAAWKAATGRVKDREAYKEAQREALGPSVSEPSGSLPSEKCESLLRSYKAVRTTEEFAAVRKLVGAALGGASPAQKQILKEADEAANKLLMAQKEAAQ